MIEALNYDLVRPNRNQQSKLGTNEVGGKPGETNQKGSMITSGMLNNLGEGRKQADSWISLGLGLFSSEYSRKNREARVLRVEQAVIVLDHETAPITCACI